MNIISRPSNKKYLDNFDRIFGKKTELDEAKGEDLPNLDPRGIRPPEEQEESSDGR